MRCLLIQHGWEAALDLFPGTMTRVDKNAALKTDVYKKAHSALLLCLDNKVLREVNKEDYVVGGDSVVAVSFEGFLEMMDLDGGKGLYEGEGLVGVGSSGGGGG
ncbi:hypothetical protein Tco_1283458 [Tanacetum coccineum]